MAKANGKRPSARSVGKRTKGVGGKKGNAKPIKGTESRGANKHGPRRSPAKRTKGAVALSAVTNPVSPANPALRQTGIARWKAVHMKVTTLVAIVTFISMAFAIITAIAKIIEHYLG